MGVGLNSVLIESLLCLVDFAYGHHHHIVYEMVVCTLGLSAKDC